MNGDERQRPEEPEVNDESDTPQQGDGELFIDQAATREQSKERSMK